MSRQTHGTARSGRPAKSPNTPHGKMIQQRLRALGWTRSRLARALGVSPATVTRYLNDDNTAVYSIDPFAVCQVLGFEDMERRTFLELVGVAIVMPAVVLHRGIDLDVYDSALDAWSVALYQRYAPADTLKQVEQISAKLKYLQEAAVYSAKDTRFAEVRIRAEMFRAALQEAVLPWWQERPRVAMRTYAELDREVFRVVGPEKFGEEYARLLIRRATLFREGKEGDHLAESAHQFEQIAHYFNDTVIGNPVVLVAYACQRLHTVAVQGDFHTWSKERDKVIKYVEGLRVDPPLKQELWGIVAYALGVGNKRFMWQLRDAESASRQREEFAREAQNWLGQLRSRGQGGIAVHNINLYHPGMPAAHSEPELESSEIDALVWSDPEQAIRRAAALAYKAGLIYPSVARKSEAQILLAQKLAGQTPTLWTAGVAYSSAENDFASPSSASATSATSATSRTRCA